MMAIHNEARKKRREKASIQASTAVHNGEFAKVIQLEHYLSCHLLFSSCLFTYVIRSLFNGYICQYPDI